MADSLKSARNVDNGKSTKGRAVSHRPYGSRIIRRVVKYGRVFELHATKG